MQQADMGFARSQLCTNDGTTNNLVLYMARNVLDNKPIGAAPGGIFLLGGEGAFGQKSL